MAELPARPEPPLPLAVSQCLLGDAVRYDGSDARCCFPHAALSGVFEYRGICPEVGIGLGTPRPPIRVVDTGRERRVRGVEDPSLDVTAALTEYAQHQAAALHDVCGYVLMKGSPSCGLFGVKVYAVAADGTVATTPVRSGRGAYAAAVVACRPELPVEENARLHDPVLRDSFVTRVFAYAHWQALERAGITSDGLVEFHRRYRYLLMAHSVPHYRRAGRLIAAADGDIENRAHAYVSVLLAGLARFATRRGHVNVLARLQGQAEQYLDSAGRHELDDVIRGYRRGELPLAAPVGLLRQQLRQHPDTGLARQIYLDPHPGYSAAR